MGPDAIRNQLITPHGDCKLYWREKDNREFNVSLPLMGIVNLF